MKGKFVAYVLWPLAKIVQNLLVNWSTARDFTVHEVASSMFSVFLGTFKVQSNFGWIPPKFLVCLHWKRHDMNAMCSTKIEEGVKSPDLSV